MRILLAFTIVLVFGLLAGASWLSRTSSEEVIRQPIEFNHAVHAKENIACDDCHSKADEKPNATLPSLKQCLLCHKEEAGGEEPAEGEEAAGGEEAAEGEAGRDPAAAERLRALARRLREYSDQGEGVPWVTVNRLVGHVYFSHVAHVRFGEMKCEECHGDMAALTKPPERSQIANLTMRRCMECHTERGASNDCLACHK